MEIVVAKYKEDVSWVYEYAGSHSNASVYVYNDHKTVTEPAEPAEPANVRVIDGDRFPCETTKYLQHILDHYDCWATEAGAGERWVVFTQADPFFHSPDFLALLECSHEWASVQPLSLYGAPPEVNEEYAPVVREEIPNVVRFSNGARVWYDEMDTRYQGKYLQNKGWEAYTDFLGDDYFPSLWRLFGLTRIPQRLYKSYAAIFAVRTRNITKHSKEMWKNIYDWVLYGDNRTHTLTVKDRAIIMEYTWWILLVGESGA